jgi:lycopene cyclase domain-containing protein
LPLALAGIAFAFSCVWDNLLAWRGVWIIEANMVVGTAAFMPFEEYFWFIDHTLLASVWVLVLWSRKQTLSDPMVPPRRAARAVGAGLCAVATLAGVASLQEPRTFYLGVILAFMSPVIGSQWWLGGHLLLQQPREWVLGIAVPAAYLLLVDTWAIREGVWRISEQFVTGRGLSGVTVEHLLLYSATTALVVLPLVIGLRLAELQLQVEAQAE